MPEISFPPKPTSGRPPPPRPKTLAEKIQKCSAASVDPENPRQILIQKNEGEIIAKAICLSEDMVFATIYLEGGGFSNHYMPLRHFLELYPY